MKQFSGRLFAGRLFAGRLFRTPVHDAVPGGSISSGRRQTTINKAVIRRQNELILALVIAAVTEELI